MLYSPIICGWQVYWLFSDDQHVKFIEGQVTEAGASGSDLVSSTAPNENFRENGSFYLLQRNIKAKTGLEEAVVNQATVWPESGADRTASSRENPVPSTAPNQYNPNQIFQIGNGFGFFLIFLSQRHNTPDLAGKFSVLKGGTLLESLRTSIQRNCHFLIYKHKAVFSFGNMVYLAQ